MITQAQEDGLILTIEELDAWFATQDCFTEPARFYLQQLVDGERSWSLKVFINNKEQTIKGSMPEELLSKLLENTDYRNDFLGKLKRKIEALVTISFYNVHFEILFFGKFNDVTFQNRLAEKPSWCRFCKKSVPEVTFTSIAHAIPESIGNRHIVCHNECDSCNTFFGRTIENDFGNWSKPHRTIAQISGKNGIPQLGRTKGKWNIKCVGDTTFIRGVATIPAKSAICYLTSWQSEQLASHSKLLAFEGHCM